MYLLLAIILVVLKAAYDGFQYRGWKKVSEFFGVGLIAVFIIFPFLWMTGTVHPPDAWTLDRPYNLWKIFVGVASFWFGCFDTLVNWTMGQKWYYIGTAKVYDQTVRRILDKTRVPIGLFRFIQLCFFIFGALILFYGNTDKILN